MLTNGVSLGTKCQITTNFPNGTSSSFQVVPQCGYNQNSNYYCPWALGDAPTLLVLESIGQLILKSYNKCGVKSYISDCAYLQNLIKMQNFDFKMSKFLNFSALYFPVSAYLSNNAECVKSTLT